VYNNLNIKILKSFACDPLLTARRRYSQTTTTTRTEQLVFKWKCKQDAFR